MKITLKQLQVFTAIARCGSLSKAADDVCITQSAASMALAELERQLDEKLFDRVGRRLELNDIGRLLMPKAQGVMERVEEIEAICLTESTAITGTVKIGASTTIGNYVLPSIIGAFVRAHPSTRPLLDVGNTEYINTQLLNFTIDLGLIEGHCDHPHVVSTPWAKDRLIVFAAPDHPLAQQKTPPIDAVCAADWILRERGSGTRDVFQRALGRQIDQINVFLELGHTEAIKQAVEAGLGISCLSIQAIQRPLEEGKVVEIPTPCWDLNRYFYLLVHKDKYQSRLIREFTHFSQKAAPPMD